MDETAEKAADRGRRRPRPPKSPPKSYASPTLVKRERLARITAVPAASAIVTDSAPG